MSFGFGSGFGANTSPFGTTSPSPFGQSTPAFGQNTSPFGASSSTGVFGQSQQQPAFGAAPAFGASTPAFGAAPSAFGAASAPAFGSSSFGAKPAGTGFGFGAPASTPSPFGATSTPAFGATSTPAFGASTSPAFGAASPSPFGAAPTTTGFGQSTPAFGASSTSAFGQAPSFGAPQTSIGGFGAPSVGGFGGATSPGGRGSRVAPWRKTQETDTSSTGARSTVYYNSISCMPEYASKSAEEIRWEDYQDGVKGGGSTSTTSTSTGLFGAPAASPFGAPAGGAAPSPFGASSTPGFGATTSTPAFGAGGFGASSTPAFGGVSTPAFGFGSTPSPSPSPFGASTGSAAPFGQSAGAFGATSTPAFGAPSAPAFGGFGGPTSTPAFGVSTSTPAFGVSTSTPAFGATSAPAFGGFGAASTPSAFGVSSTPAFGASSTPTFSFAGPTSTPTAFGATSAPSFGAASSGTSLFGAASTPAFGATPTSGGGLFGATTTPKPASTPGFSFSSTPAFGATPTPAFGASTGGGLFGASSTPAFGASTGGSLFGGASTTTPSFSFAPATGGAPTPGGLGSALTLPSFGGVPAGGLPFQAPTVGTNPYGQLPEPPRVTPLPEYKVGLTQRILAPPSGGPPRHVALITPRSLTPQTGGKIRPRRSASALRMSQNPAEFLAAAAGAVGPSPARSMSGTPNGNGTPSNLFVPRDNPRKLFIRDALPSTEAAGGVSVSPGISLGEGSTPLKPSGLRTPTGSGLRITPSGGDINGLTPLHISAGRENGMGAPSGARLMDDASISAILPSVRRQDYYTEPSLTQLAAMARDDPQSLSEVSNFTVGRRGVGSIRWLDPVDVRGLDIDAIVNLSRGSVEVYLDENDKPEVGCGLNRPAEVSMLKVFKVDKETGKPTKDPEVVEKFSRKLKKVAAEQGARFILYDGATGTWKFEVEHFSRYGLVGDDSDDSDGGGDDNECVLQDFGVGGDTMVKSNNNHTVDLIHSDKENLEEMEDDEDEDDVAGFGVRRAAMNAKQAASTDDMQSQPISITIDDNEKLPQSMVEGVAAGLDYTNYTKDDTMRRQNLEREKLHVPTPTRKLHVSLPERMDIGAEELLRLVQSGLMHPQLVHTGPLVSPQGPQVEHQLHEEVGFDDGQNIRMTSHAVIPKNAWVSTPVTPLNDGRKNIQMARRVSQHAQTSPCPFTPASFKAFSTSSRSIPDTGLFLGGSCRAGWGPRGVFCAPSFSNNRSVSCLAVQKMTVGSRIVTDPGSNERQSILKRRVKDFLAVHYENSLPEPLSENDLAMRPPRWRLQCSRSHGALRKLTQELIQICNEHAAAMAGPEYAIDRTVLRHQASAWELLHALFSSVPADAVDDEGNVKIGGGGEEKEEEEMEATEAMDTKYLATMQRRAELSRWLRDRSRASTEHAVAMSRTDTARVLSLLTGHQIASATAAATIHGDIRLATLIASAGSSTYRKNELNAQLTIWKDAGYTQLIDPERQLIYHLLAGHVDAVIPNLPESSSSSGQKSRVSSFDWKRALGCHLWYGCSPAEGIETAMEAFESSLANGTAPSPRPPYMNVQSSTHHVEQEKTEKDDVDEDIFDVNFELIRLFCLSVAGMSHDDTGDDDDNNNNPSNEYFSMGTTSMSLLLNDLVSRLLRPGTTTPDPLDYAFSWQLLCMLQSIAAIPEDQPQTNRTVMAFISQLECIGELSHWAVYVALHLPNPSIRQGVVKQLLACHCPEWMSNEQVTTFMIDSLQVPPSWLAEARALYARYRKDDVTELIELIDAGDVARAHSKLAEWVAPRWITSSDPMIALDNLEQALMELESYADAIDDLMGPGTWYRGGGLFAAYLSLRHLYSLASTSNNKDTIKDIRGDTIVGYEERMSACAQLVDRLNDALAALPTHHQRAEQRSGSRDLDQTSASMALRRAALGKMAEQLAEWVMSDADCGHAGPGIDHVVKIAGLRSLRYGKVAGAVQAGAVAVASSFHLA